MKKFRSPLPPLKTLSATLAACFAVAAQALPTAPSVSAGNASFQQSGNSLTVTNSNGTIINWNSFSIGAGESTRFIQPTVSSSVLNRVVGGDPSQIYGTLSSNGRIYLVNPSGIFVGPGGRVDAAAFIASTLALSDQDFLAGRLAFTRVGNGGAVENQGVITTPEGGSVYLVGSQVSNSGGIAAPNGEVILAAGQAVQLVNTGTPGVTVEFSASDEGVQNFGSIAAAGGRIGLAAALVRNSGILNASSVSREGGRIFLRASKQVEVDGAGRILANGTQGGTVQLQSDDLTLVSGKIEAKGSTAAGGRVEVLGDKVGVFDGASIDASGESGGGTILVGGDLQGGNAEIKNAFTTWFGQDARLDANAGRSGDGGKIIVWADDTTRAYGQISARGGAESGNGGFAEVSGHRYLDYQALADLRAPNGDNGSLLLDPGSIFVSVSGTGPSYGGGNAPVAGTEWTLSGGDSPALLFWDSVIEPQFAFGNVTLTTSAAVGDGSITFSPGLYSSGTTNTLRLLAGSNGVSPSGNITLDGAQINLPYGGVELYAGWNGSTTVPQLSGAYGNILLAGGSVGPANITAASAKLFAAGNITLNGTSGAYGGSVKTTGDLLVQARNLVINAAAFSFGYGGSFLSSVGNQTFNLGLDGDLNHVGGGVSLVGASGSTVINGFAGIEQTGPGGSQTFNLYGGSAVSLSGGSSLTTGSACFPGDTSNSCAGNSARIEAVGAGGQFFLFHDVGGSINLTAGSSTLGVGRNSAEIHYSSTGQQVIQGMTGGVADLTKGPAIAVNGGAGGGAASLPYGGAFQSVANEAIISADGSQVIKATGINMNGGGSYGGGGFYGGAFIVGPNQDITVYGGDLRMAGGYGGGIAYQVNTGVFVPSGAAFIGRDSDATINITLDDAGGSTGNLDMNFSSGAGGNAAIGSLSGRANVTVNTKGAVLLGTTGGGQARIGSTNGISGSSINIHSDQDGCVTLCGPTTGMLLNGELRVGTSDTIQLTSDVAGISQNATVGAVYGGTLLANAYGSILMGGANQVPTVALASSTGNLSYRTVAPTTNVAASAFGAINIIANPLSLTPPGGPGNLALGLLSAGGSVSVSADGAILDNNGTATNIATPGSVTMSSSSGGSSAGTLAVSADIDGASSINVVVPATATYGGIRINHTNVAAGSTVITLSDNSLLGGQFVDYTTNANIDATRFGQLTLASVLTPVRLFTSGAIDLSTPLLGGFSLLSSNGSVGIQAGGNLILGNASIFAGNNVVATAGGLLDLSGSLIAGNTASVSGSSINLGSVATLSGANGATISTPGALTIAGAVSSSAGAVAMTAGTVQLQSAASVDGTTGVTANSVGDVALSGASISSAAGVAVTSSAGAITLDNGSSIVGASAGSTVKLSAATGISLNNGSSIVSGNDIHLTLQGATAALILNGTSFVLADTQSPPGQTIYLDFLGRSSGGIVIDGVESSNWSVGGSGLFTGNLSTIATLGFGLVMNYVGGVDPVASAIGTIFDTGTRDTENINDIETEEVQALAAEIAEEEESGEEQENNATPSEGNEDGSGKSKPAQCT